MQFDINIVVVVVVVVPVVVVAVVGVVGVTFVPAMKLYSSARVSALQIGMSERWGTF